MSLTVSNGQLLLDGSPCNHTGVNAAYLLARRFFSSNDTQHIETLDTLSGMGVKVIRCVATPNFVTPGGIFDWGTPTGLSAAFYTAQDVIYNYAATKGIQIIPTLFSNYWSIANFRSETCNQLGVPGSALRNWLESCAAEYVTRYLNHPAIAAWEISNEWNNWAELSAYPPGNDFTGNPYSNNPANLITIGDLISSFKAIGSVIRSIDSEKAILSGNAGPWYTNRFGLDGYGFILQLINPDPIDTTSVHLYSYPTNGVWMRQGYSPMPDIIGQVKEVAKLTGKPAILGEIGINENLASQESDFTILTEFLTSDKKTPLNLLWNFYKPDSTNPPSNPEYDFYVTGNRTKYIPLIEAANLSPKSGESVNSADFPTSYLSLRGNQCAYTSMPNFNDGNFTLSYWVRYFGSRNDNFPRVISATSNELDTGFTIVDLSTSSGSNWGEHYFRGFLTTGQSATLRSGKTYQEQWKQKTFVFKNWSNNFTADPSSNTLTLNSINFNVQTGDLVQLTTTGTLPSGLSSATNYYVRVLPSGQILLFLGQADAYLGLSTRIVTFTTAGTGTHTITAKYLSVYDNGLKATSDIATVFTGTWQNPTGNFVIGANRTFNGDFFRGDIAKVKIWPRGLTEIEVWNNYSGKYPAGYLEYLTSDTSNLTLVGSPAWVSSGTRTVETRSVASSRNVRTTTAVTSIRGTAP